VAEITSVGGFEREYQVVVDPRKLQAYGIPLSRVSEAVQASNQDVGGRTIELTETEYMVRGRGYLKSAGDLERVVLKAGANGTPVLLRDVARVHLGPAERRGIADLNEGTLLYMPVTPPGLSITKATELLQVQDRIIKGFPEVASVFGKAGRAATATDAAPTEMSETGVIMLIYLDHALGAVRARAAAEGRAMSRADLAAAIMAGLAPILWSTGTGSEVMRRIAAPMVGGMVSSTVLTLLVIPALYALAKGWRLPRTGAVSFAGEQSGA